MTGSEIIFKMNAYGYEPEHIAKVLEMETATIRKIINKKKRELGLYASRRPKGSKNKSGLISFAGADE